MTKDDIFKQIVSHTKKVVPELNNHNFLLEDSLKELGANSIDRAEIITLMMETAGLEIPRLDFSNAKNIGDLVNVFYAKIHTAL